jgi:hypothetical protein
MTQQASPEPALKGIVDRLEVWSGLLRREIEEAQRSGSDGGDRAAVSFLRLLADVLGEHDRAFARYRAQTLAAPDVRLRWLQTVGTGLGLLVHNLGTLERALPPSLTPLVSAFARLLGELIPGRAAVFVPERFFNYELREIHAKSFEHVLGANVDAHTWPALFLKLPLGLLDSPRNHILLGHELGHALAAVARAETQKHSRLVEAAKRAGTVLPDPPPPLLPRPNIDTARILPIAQQMCREGGINVPAPSTAGQVGIGQLILQGLIAKVASDVSSITERWVEELFADAVGVCLFGPAFTKAFADVLLPTGRLAQASHDHPPHAVRITFQRDLLARKEFGDFASIIPAKLKERLDAVSTLASSALSAVPGSTTSTSERDTYALSHLSVQTVLDEIMSVAIARTNNLLYTATRYSEDLDRYLESFRTLGVPPISVTGERRVSLATILNVSQLVAMEASIHVHQTADPLSRERGLDDLILKAIELAEFQIGWEEA